MSKKCRCGKIAWPTEQQARDTLVRAKIEAALRGNARRRESRAYPCDIAPGWWHLTSLEQWDDRSTQVEIAVAEDMDRDAAVEELLDLFEQHAEAVQRLVKREARTTTENAGLRDAVKSLAVAIDRHRRKSELAMSYREQDAPSRFDSKLWNSLDDVAIPAPSGKERIARLLETDWADPHEIANDPTRRAIALGPKRLTALALGHLGLVTVSRLTVRALLPRGTVKAGTNKMSVKFGAALQSFEARGWIERDPAIITVLEHATLADHAIDGTTLSPHGVLDTENALNMLIDSPTSEQRDREILAVKRLENLVI